MVNPRTRLSLIEYGTPVDLSRAIAEAIGVDRTKANSLLLEAGSRIASSLRLSYNPISVDAKGTRAIDFAGLIRLAPSLELEVAPKFLGLDDTDAAWREDFFSSPRFHVMGGSWLPNAYRHQVVPQGICLR